MKRPQKPLVSVIVLNYETPKLTLACLKSLSKANYKNIEVVVLDNGSRGNDLFFLKNKISDRRFKFIRSKINLGFGGGCNLALPYCKGDYLMLLNSDVEVDPDFLGPLIKFMEANHRVGVLQPKVLSLKNKQYFDCAGAGVFLDIFGVTFSRGRIFSSVEKDEGQYDEPIEISFATGAAIFIRQALLEKIGFFEPFFFAYSEDADLCLRIWRSGFKVIALPQSIVYHLGGGSSQNSLFQRRYLQHRGEWLLVLGNYRSQTLIWVLPIRLLLDWAQIFRSFLIGRAYDSLSILKAWGFIIKNFPQILKIRKRDQRIMKEFPAHLEPPIYKGCIVFDFMRGKKTFGEIFDPQRF